MNDTLWERIKQQIEYDIENDSIGYIRVLFESLPEWMLFEYLSEHQIEFGEG